MGRVVGDLDRKSGSTVIDERLWTIEEFAKFLGIAVGTAYHLVSQKRVPVVRISSRCIRFRPSEIAAWLEKNTQKERE